MTVREYIGARYVPLFMGDWDNTNTYEPLSIVMYEGDSYTSRQYVPTGISIDNDVYWAQTGNFSSQVEAYREEVMTFDDRIDALEGKYDANGKLEDNIVITDSITDSAVTESKIASNAVTEGKIASNAVTESKIASNAVTEGKIASNAVTESKIANGAITENKIASNSVSTAKISDASITNAKLANEVKIAINKRNLKGRKIVVIGDSLTSAVGATKNWPTYLHEMLDCTCYNFAVSGQGFVNNAGGTFYSQVTSAINDTSFDNHEITDVIVMGGYNDWAYESTLHSAVTTLFNYIKSNFIYATMWCGAMLKGVYPLNYALGGATAERGPLINIIEKAASLCGAIIMQSPWLWCMGVMAAKYDNVHLNDDGQHIVAGKVATCLFGGNPCPTYFDKHTTIDVNANIDEGYYDIECTNGVVTLRGFVSTTASLSDGTRLFTVPEWAWVAGDDAKIVFNVGQSISAGSVASNNYRVPIIYLDNGSQVKILQCQTAQDLFFCASWTMGI